MLLSLCGSSTGSEVPEKELESNNNILMWTKRASSEQAPAMFGQSNNSRVIFDFTRNILSLDSLPHMVEEVFFFYLLV